MSESKSTKKPFSEHIYDYIGLSLIPGIGEIRFHRLISHFKTASAVFDADIQELMEAGKISLNRANVLKAGYNQRDVESKLSKLKDCNISIITLEDADYPENLRQLNDPPPLLYFQGEIKYADSHCIAIVGSRKASPYGKSMTTRISEELVDAGFTVVSGFARGIDTIAHRTALDCDGKTIAVMGCGIDVVYPSENKELFTRITQSGCIISEFEPGKPPEARNFPKRNRLISGIASGVVIVEAAIKSGALLTANHALEQGREVFAVPGPVNSPSSEGTNNLIKSGAKLTTSINDILEELKIQLKCPPISRAEKDKLGQLDGEQKVIYQNLDTVGVQIDKLVESTKIDISRLLGHLLEMELAGYVKTLPGKRYVRI
ncbi:MAG: DNA-protecting protein DprA [candidate division Zixibacteria bacterium]|nr:DNA-protecting protein DprA [candidate division Zixibacteria bacterium]